MSPRFFFIAFLALCLTWSVSGRKLSQDDSSSDSSNSDGLMPSISSHILEHFSADHFGDGTLTHSGDGTAYSDAVPNTGAGFACSFRYLNDKFSHFFAAINSAQWNEGRSCGRCIVARCTDPMCTVNQPIKVQIVDLCPECAEGDVDFSFGAYRTLTGLWPHRLQIEWEWTDCAEDITGNLRFDPKDGINQFWQSFYISNSRYPISSIKLNGAELQRSQFNFWIHAAAMPEGGCTLEMTADNGETITASVPDFSGTHDLGVQFPIQ